mmetsp:Transcript_83787/g.234784  ORF Transcript_83787/g.234784 Transcript_83787/m.234784 type:complete len:363 (-) Transcript_83787:303-1391(-)
MEKEKEGDGQQAGGRVEVERPPRRGELVRASRGEGDGVRGADQEAVQKDGPAAPSRQAGRVTRCGSEERRSHQQGPALHQNPGGLRSSLGPIEAEAVRLHVRLRRRRPGGGRREIRLLRDFRPGVRQKRPLELQVPSARVGGREDGHQQGAPLLRLLAELRVLARLLHARRVQPRRGRVPGGAEVDGPTEPEGPQAARRRRAPQDHEPRRGGRALRSPASRRARGARGEEAGGEGAEGPAEAGGGRRQAAGGGGAEGQGLAGAGGAGGEGTPGEGGPQAEAGRREGPAPASEKGRAGEVQPLGARAGGVAGDVPGLGERRLGGPVRQAGGAACEQGRGREPHEGGGRLVEEGALGGAGPAES